jgi:hypothetical protein
MTSFLSKERTRSSFDSRLNGKTLGTKKGDEVPPEIIAKLEICAELYP